MLKATFRIPAKEMYGYIELETEVETVEQALDGYKGAMAQYNSSGVGLDPKEWNRALDGYLTVGNCPSDVYERMNDEQKRVMQEIKKSLKRINPPDKRD